MKKSLVAIPALIAAGYLVYAFVLPRFTGDEQSPRLDPTRITEEVNNGTAVLLDVRTDAELQTVGYAAGSTHFDLARLQAGELPSISQDITIYAYCKGGARAGRAKDILEQNDFTHVENIGGLVDWENAGGTVIRE